MANAGAMAQKAINVANIKSLATGGGYYAPNVTAAANANALGTAVGNGLGNSGGFSAIASGPGWY